METVLYVNGNFFTGTEVLRGGCMEVGADGTITAIGTSSGVAAPGGELQRIIDLHGKTVLPGFVDVHVHGGGGYDLLHGEPEDFRGAAKFHAAHGTTSIVASTGGAPEAVTLGILRNARIAQEKGTGGADVIGVHLEGPFLNPCRKGAFPESWLHPPDWEEMERYIAASGDTIRIATIAPELPGGEAFVRRLAARGISVSIGHSDATYEQVLDAVEWGARHTTHHFNGMSPFHHRDPGVAGAGLMHPSLSLELIADGVHVHPAAVRFLFETKGVWNVCVITDAVSQAGLPDGEYADTVVAEGKIYLKGTKTLAGSSSTMLRSLHNVMAFTGRSLENILPSFTIIPAGKAGAGKRKGALVRGLDADFLVLDDRLGLLETYVRGTCVYSKEKEGSVC